MSRLSRIVEAIMAFGLVYTIVDRLLSSEYERAIQNACFLGLFIVCGLWARANDQLRSENTRLRVLLLRKPGTLMPRPGRRQP